MGKIIHSLTGVYFHTFDNVFDIFFTEERVIACNVKHHNDIPYQQSSAIRGLFITGFSGKQEEQINQAQITYERRQSLQDKTPDELMALHRSNFEISYSEIISIELSRGLFRSYLKFNTSNPSPLRQKICFLLSKKQIPDAQGIIEWVLASKVKKK
ncbi:hypothetical protein ACFLYQ_01405 [Chloroflexota bacterium]